MMNAIIKRCQEIIDHSSYQVQNEKVMEESKEWCEVLKENAMPHRILDEGVDVVITAIQKMLLEGNTKSEIMTHIDFKLDRTEKKLEIRKVD